MILQISENDSIIIKCLTFDNMPKTHSFFLSIQDNHLYISRNAGEEMKIHLGKSGEQYLPIKLNDIGKNNFAKLIKSKPSKKGVILIKLEKE